MEQSNPIELEMLRKLLGAGSFLLFLPSYFYFSTKPCHCIEDSLVQLQLGKGGLLLFRVL